MERELERDERDGFGRVERDGFVSSATWQGDFLVKNPSSRYSIYYDGDDAAVSLGSQNVAVLNVTSRRVSRDHTAFSLSFVAEEGNRSDVVSEDLKIRLMGKHKRYTFDDEAGFFNIRCQNVTRGREKIICESSFTDLKLMLLKRPQRARSGGTIG
ncbi:hypothetical protein Bca52824_004723 [Brassica carinata]|uniref:Uncharacterized protein n=1 Tax=Brassica carinata TaxID=52824 RepID=A0A8X7WMG1_BRACI|nr:hypothetical protein Bca52824_004723 [Brassica carinata]